MCTFIPCWHPHSNFGLSIDVQISIIIINWNSANYLRSCLRSLYACVQNVEFETIVVDNGSFDGCETLIRTEFPKVTFVQSRRNLGFAKANNLGYSKAAGDMLLFLNPDTEIVGWAVHEMFSFLLNTPVAGAVGCRLLNSDLSWQTSCVQAFPTIANQVMDVERLRMLFPRLKLWGIKSVLESETTAAEVDVLCGACLMVKRKVFEAIGLFSEDYFMFGEDVDLCYKVKRAGFGVYYLNGCEIIHHGGRSSSRQENSFFSVLAMKESRMIFFRKTRSHFYAYLYRCAMLMTSICRIVLICLIWPVPERFLPTTNLNYALRKWLTVLRWSIGGS